MSFGAPATSLPTRAVQVQASSSPRPLFPPVVTLSPLPNFSQLPHNPHPAPLSVMANDQKACTHRHTKLASANIHLFEQMHCPFKHPFFVAPCVRPWFSGSAPCHAAVENLAWESPRRVAGCTGVIPTTLAAMEAA